MTLVRGNLVPLTMNQIAARAKYLGKLVTGFFLDKFVVLPAPKCPDGYYLLEDHNGGKDPTAADPFERWSKPGSIFINRTADCVAGMAWCGGWDRLQPERFKHLYNGYINTNSSLLDAFGKQKCFVPCDRPMPGSFIVAPTGAIGFEKCGHVATVYETPLEWDPNERECWAAVKVVDIASRSPNPANKPSTAVAWFAARQTPASGKLVSAFIRSIMV